MYSAGHADIMKHKKDVGGESMLTLDMVREAQEALRGIARRTPLDRAPKFGENVYIKAENLQLTGAFKLRGAYNKIRSLTPEEAARGVIACSAGNHAQGIALSASRLGIKAVICMPAGAPISKVEATRGYGAEVVLVPGVYDDAAAEAERLTKEQGYTFAHPFNDPLVIAGQGTIGLEILEQLPDVEQIVVPIGGGGLIGGIAFAVKQLKPDCRIVGAQAAGATRRARRWRMRLRAAAARSACESGRSWARMPTASSSSSTARTPPCSAARGSSVRWCWRSSWPRPR